MKLFPRLLHGNRQCANQFRSIGRGARGNVQCTQQCIQQRKRKCIENTDEGFFARSLCKQTNVALYSSSLVIGSRWWSCCCSDYQTCILIWLSFDLSRLLLIGNSITAPLCSASHTARIPQWVRMCAMHTHPSFQHSSHSVERIFFYTHYFLRGRSMTKD